MKTKYIKNRMGGALEPNDLPFDSKEIINNPFVNLHLKQEELKKNSKATCNFDYYFLSSKRMWNSNIFTGFSKVNKQQV